MCRSLAIVHIFLFFTSLTLHLATPDEFTSAFFFHEFPLRVVTPTTAKNTTVIQRTLRFPALPVLGPERPLGEVAVAVAGRLPYVYEVFGCVFIVLCVGFNEFHFSFLSLAPLVKLDVYRTLESVFQVFPDLFEVAELSVACLRGAVLGHSVTTALDDRFV